VEEGGREWGQNEGLQQGRNMSSTVRSGISMEIEVAIYRKSVLEELALLINVLRDTLGVGMVARMAGVTETRAVHQWADGQRAVRSPSVANKLRLAYQATALLTQEHPPEVAARWFEYPCPSLDYRSPSSALASSPPEIVGQGFISAAREFLGTSAGHDVDADDCTLCQRHSRSPRAPEALFAG